MIPNRLPRVAYKEVPSEEKKYENVITNGRALTIEVGYQWGGFNAMKRTWRRRYWAAKLISEIESTVVLPGEIVRSRLIANPDQLLNKKIFL